MKNKTTISSLKAQIKTLKSELESCRLQLEVYRDLAGSYERSESKLVIEVNEQL